MIRFFAAHPTAANLILLGIIVLGLAALPELKRSTFPDLPLDTVEVRTLYKGAAAEDVEEVVCQRLEDALDGLTALDELRCEAREGLAVATVEMREGSPFEQFLADVRTEVEAIRTFPEDVEDPTVEPLGRTDYVAAIAVTGPENPADLKAYAEDLKDRLLRLPAISLIEITGFSDHQIRIEIPESRLRQYGLSLADIADQIQRQNIAHPTGSLETRDADILIRFDGDNRSVEDFRDLVVVAGASGGEVLLGDIARITDRFELDEQKVLFDGKRAALLEVTKNRAEDSLVVMEALQHFLDRERAQAPTGLTLAITRDISSVVRDRLSMLMENGVQGLALVFLAMWLFFGFRYSFWVTMGLPVSFLGTLFAMSVLGYSIDMMTMVGLLIAVGLLMDDAIVISENVAARRRAGDSAFAAAVNGTRQVAPGVIASFVTTICLFGSLVFLKGDLGAILRVMPVILILTLAVSLIEAFLILPNHLAHAMGASGTKPPGRVQRVFEAGFTGLRERVIGPLVDWAVTWRYLALGLILGLLLLCVSLIAGGVLKFMAFPDLDGDVIQARILLPQGTPLAQTQKVIDKVLVGLEQVNEDLTPEQPEQQPLVRHVLLQYATHSDAHETGPHLATLSVDLLSTEIRTHSADAINALWRDKVGRLPDVLSLTYTQAEIGPAGKAVELRLQGDDLMALHQASLELQAWLRRYVGLRDLFDDLRPGKPEMRVRLRPGASALGFNAQSIAAQIRAAYQGTIVEELQIGPEPYEIDVRIRAEDRDSLADLESLFVTNGQGQEAPLPTVAILEPGRGWARIHRVDGQRTVTLQADIDTRIANAAEIVADTQKRFIPGLLERYPGLRLDVQGQNAKAAKTGGSLGRNFLIGLIGIYLLLAYQFRSYVEPVAVMTAIPLALIGVVLGHLLMGYSLSMPSMMGLASLAGVVVNDSILLVSFIKQRRRDGESTLEAAPKAARQRFRAIMLTSITTALGVTPLLLEQSLQAQIMIPLAISLAFGLTTATLISLLLVPATYAILDDFGLVEAVGTKEKDEKERDGAGGGAGEGAALAAEAEPQPQPQPTLP